MKDGRIFTESGLLLASNHVRIVEDERGNYFEIRPKEIIKENIRIPVDKLWKLDHEKSYYVEYRSTDSYHVKIYYQKRLVTYADYKIGYYYISVENVNCPSHGLGRYLKFPKKE